MIKQIKRYENGLGDGDYLQVEDGAIEVSSESGYMLVSEKITNILMGNPVGKPLKFDPVLIDCTCGERDCNSYAVMYDDGSMTVRREDYERYNTKIDPRYTAKIYKYWLGKQKKNAQAKARRLARRAT